MTNSVMFSALIALGKGWKGGSKSGHSVSAHLNGDQTKPGASVLAPPPDSGKTEYIWVHLSTIRQSYKKTIGETLLFFDFLFISALRELGTLKRLACVCAKVQNSISTDLRAPALLWVLLTPQSTERDHDFRPLGSLRPSETLQVNNCQNY